MRFLEDVMPSESISQRNAQDRPHVSTAIGALRVISTGELPMEAGDIAPATNISSPTLHNMVQAVCALINAVDCALAGRGDTARQYVSRAFRSLDGAPSSLDTDATDADGAAADRCRGGLAPWQIRRVSTHIEEHLGDTIQCEDLARLVRLSLSHFVRAFRESFGCPPHMYLMRRRLQRAQRLMLTTDIALGQIALECGLADQSHLSRLFQKFVGESPAARRRARVHMLPPAQ
jgi:AraC-like DNA-binding protein